MSGKSVWDSKEDIQLPAQINEKNACHGNENYSNLHVSHDSKLPDLGVDNALKSKDCSGRSSWESSQGNNGQKDESRDFNDIPEIRKARDEDKSYHLSPGSDGWKQQNHSRYPENSGNQSRRYRRSRSQSRSRSRSRARDRSRSRSQGRGTSRSRSRSRDRNWGRCRSPLGDYRRESYRSSDRRSGSGVSSQPCRDFTLGKCRRGNECRFLHQHNLSHRDGGRLERDQAERWRIREERGGNFYDGQKDERPMNSSKSTMLCNDFLKGRCQRGSSCRYLHHDASGDNSERGNRHSSVDHDYRRQLRKNFNPPCKFFMMGKCQRDNCRFSHDCPAPINLEGMPQDDRRGHDFDDMNKSWDGTKWGEATAVSDIAQSTRWVNVGKGTSIGSITAEKHADGRRGHDFDDMNKSWNGPKWGEAAAVSDIAESTGWGDVGKGTSIGPITAEKQTDDRRGHCLDDKNKQWNDPKWGDATDVSENAKSTGWCIGNVENLNLTDSMNAEKCADDSLDNENRMWGSPLWKDKVVDRDENVSRQLGGGSHVVNIGSTGSKDVAKSFDREESRLTSHGLQSQTPYGIPENVHEQNRMQEASGRQLATTVMHSVFPVNSQIQQQHHHTKMRDNNAKTDDLNSVNSVDIYGNASYPALVPVQNFNQNPDSFGPQPPSFGGVDQSKHTISINPSKGHNIDSNWSLQQNFSPSNLQNQTQIQHGESLKPMVNSGMPLNIVNSEQVAQITNLQASLTQIFGNGQLPQLYAALNLPNSTELAPSLPDAVTLLPPITLMDAQPDKATMSQNPLGDSTEPNKPGNYSQPPGFLSNSVEQKNKMLLEHSTASAAVGLDNDKLDNNGCPVENDHRSPELRQQKPVENSGVEEDSKPIAEKCKQEPEKNPAENVNADASIGDGANGKDEKAMRLFKIALVEFVKELLKPKWKEGQLSREVHKTIVKKVVDKVTSTIQGVNVPKTQDKIDQYLSYSKPKLAKLVEAYTERFLKSA
ncbi:hypothetical protein ACSBR1_030315 [Camellia fascicularis]